MLYCFVVFALWFHFNGIDRDIFFWVVACDWVTPVYGTDIDHTTLLQEQYEQKKRQDNYTYLPRKLAILSSHLKCTKSLSFISFFILFYIMCDQTRVYLFEHIISTAVFISCWFVIFFLFWAVSLSVSISSFFISFNACSWRDLQQ